MPLPIPSELITDFIDRHGAPVLIGFLEALDELLEKHAPDQVRVALGATPLFSKLGPHAAACLASAVDYRARNLAFTLKYQFAGKDERDAVEAVFKAARRHRLPPAPPRTSAPVTPVRTAGRNPR